MVAACELGFDHALSADEAEAEFGWLMVQHLADSGLVTKGDAELFQTVAERWIVSDTEQSPTPGDDDEFDDAASPAEGDAPVTHRKGALQAAAKVASSASKKTGRPVSPRVKALLEDRKAS